MHATGVRSVLGGRSVQVRYWLDGLSTSLGAPAGTTSRIRVVGYVQVVVLILSHHLATGNQLSEPFLMGERVPRSDGPSTSVGTALPANVRRIGLSECLLAQEPLLHSTSLTERGVDSDVVESDRNDGEQEND